MLRPLRRLLIAIIVAVGFFGLAMKFLDLPGGPWTALRALPDRIAALLGGPADRLLARDASSVSHHAPSAFDEIQQVIGCAPPDEGADPATAQETWFWRDDAGVANFADQAPQDPAAQRNALREGWSEFYVDVTADEAVLPGGFESQLNAAAIQMYTQWRDWLGDQALVHSSVNLRFMGDEEAFMARWGHEDVGNWKPLGFYRIRTNEAVILYSPRQQRAALATAYHEMSHLITAWHLGPSPAWLNEGIAEHFETMDLTRARPRFWMDGRHIGLLRREGVVPLRELTGLSRRDWASEQAERRYASAWALVTYLQASRQGRETLATVVDAAYGQRCETDPELDAALNTYPGGIDTLEDELRRWIRGSWVRGT